MSNEDDSYQPPQITPVIRTCCCGCGMRMVGVAGDDFDYEKHPICCDYDPYEDDVTVRVRVGLNCPSGTNYNDWRGSTEVEVSEEFVYEFVQEVLEYAKNIAPKWVIDDEANELAAQADEEQRDYMDKHRDLIA